MWGWFTTIWEGLKSFFPAGSKVGDQVKSIQDRTVELCGFLPTVASVTAIVTAGNPVVTGVLATASAICQAVSPRKFKTLAGPAPTVNGVVVEGEFVGRLP